MSALPADYRPIRPGPGAPGANGTHWVRAGERAKHRRRGGAVMKMIRLRGRLRRPRPRDAAASARALRAQVDRVLAPMGLRLSADKTRLTHIEEGSGIPRVAHPIAAG